MPVYSTLQTAQFTVSPAHFPPPIWHLFCLKTLLLAYIKALPINTFVLTVKRFTICKVFLQFPSALCSVVVSLSSLFWFILGLINLAFSNKTVRYLPSNKWQTDLVINYFYQNNWHLV